jgi:hypothetical protein
MTPPNFFQIFSIRLADGTADHVAHVDCRAKTLLRRIHFNDEDLSLQMITKVALVIGGKEAAILVLHFSLREFFSKRACKFVRIVNKKCGEKSRSSVDLETED